MKKFFLKNWLLIVILVTASFLRTYKLNQVPISLFGDELDVDYHALSILKTSRDYSGNFIPFHFQSLAEWRTPLYLYSAVPTVSLFGISPLGVRLPAAIYGILGVFGIYLLVKQLTKKESLGLITGFLLAVNPWHLQYSRACFEVTMLLCFLLFGLYFFFKSFEKPKLLWLSTSLLVITPLIYSTAKLFTPILFVFLFFAYRKEILSLPKKYLNYAVASLIILGGITTYATLFSGGSQRFGYIGVFTDPIIEPEVGVDRLRDSLMRGEKGVGLQPKFIDRAIHNKFTFVGERIVNNYITSLSFDFLFVNGDPNPRHMIDGMGMFYKVEVITLLFGLLLFFTDKNVDIKIKRLIAVWILAGILPASITRDGGNHASRLILILPPLIFLMSYGFSKFYDLSKKMTAVYLLVLFAFIGLYLHNYYVHYPWDSERWWHSGWCDAVGEVKKVDESYEKIIISMADEPAWIFFAGCYQYDPFIWQKEFPLGNDVEVKGFGKISHTDKFYFGKPEGGIYSLKDNLDEKSLYLASAKEIPWNLIMEPTRVPDGLNLVKAIPFPSGEPAFYLLTKK